MDAPTTPTGFAEIIDLWPSHKDLAEDAGADPGLPKVWKHRDSIQSIYWPGIVAGAARRGISGVTLELLAEIEQRVAARKAAAKQSAA